jgi:hypothetical protein
MSFKSIKKINKEVQTLIVQNLKLKKLGTKVKTENIEILSIV